MTTPSNKDFLQVFRATDYHKVDFEQIFGKINWQPRRGAVVFIKPNLSAIWPVPGEITHPILMKKLIAYLAKFHCQIIIGETDNLGPEDKGWNFSMIIKNSGYEKFKQFPRTSVVNVEKLAQKIVKVADLELSLPQIIFDCDYYINFAKLKTHWQSGITCSLKNQMGLVPMNARKIFHRQGLQESIAKLAKAIIPDLVIIDGIEAMEGQAPHWGKLKRANLLITGQNMLQTDALAAYLIGLQPEKIPHLQMAEKLGVGKINLEKFKKFAQFMNKFAPADESTAISYFKFSVWQEGGHACTGCGRAVELVKKNVFKKHLELLPRFIKKVLWEKTDFILGKVDPQKTKMDFSKMGKIYCLGNCTKELADCKKFPHLAGCPPTNEAIIQWIFGKK